MRTVVTGGAGFIGSHLIEALTARGDEVVCLERLGGAPGWVQGQRIEFAPVGLDHADDLRAVFQGAQAVFHLAGLTEARTPGEFYAVNTEGTHRVLQAAAALGAAAPRVILASSIAALGPCRDGEPLTPDTVPCPLSHYGQSKLLAEAMVHAYADRVPATILRLPSVYGPRERGVLKFFQMVRRGFALSIGRWDREVSMLFVDDAVQALLHAAESPRAVGRTYCVAHPERVTWTRFADAAAEAVGRRPVRIAVPVPVARGIAVAAEAVARLGRRAAILNREKMRELIQASWVCDPSRAVAELGFQPQFPLVRGAATAVAWYRQAGWL
jgi:nucleoside-diphosphate-sugar epimerase